MRSAVVFMVFALVGLRHSAFAQSCLIKVNIKGVRSDKGTMYLSLYNSEKGYPKNASAAYRLSSGDIRNGACSILLAAVPRGVYAIACFHDENKNGKLDTNFLGIPTEGTGASNDAKGSFGPPKFRDAKFQLVSDTTLSITIRY